MPARSTAEMCTNTSFEPSSGWINPKPFWELNHFTVPIVIVVLAIRSLAVVRSASGVSNDYTVREAGPGLACACRSGPNHVEVDVFQVGPTSGFCKAKLFA